ncbi:MAG: TIGR03619 family F420-dependent LLM class oxidoreductase [Actinomycetota bacterium]
MGVRLGDSPAATVVALARAADELGFDFITAQDHSVAPRQWAADGGGQTWYEPFVVLSYAAAVTSRVRLLTDVLIVPYRSPFQIAKIAASLDQLSGGRLILGVGSGYLEEEFNILGASFAERGAVTDESLEVLKRCWTEEWLDVSTPHFEAKDISISPQPLQSPRPPIWVGGNSWRALRRAVERGDGWTPFFRENPERVREAVRRAGEYGLEPGRAFDIAVPIRRGLHKEDGSIDVDSALRQAEAQAEAGATHIKIGFKAASADEYVSKMETFARGVIDRFSTGNLEGP